jgi:hypothetical protein
VNEGTDVIPDRPCLLTGMYVVQHRRRVAPLRLGQQPL